MAKKKKRRKKKKNPAQKPVQKRIKTRLEMSSSEYNDLVERMNVSLYGYLCNMATDISPENRDIVARALSEELRYRMATDVVFFDKVNAFVNLKAGAGQTEKDAFCFELVRDIYSRGRIKESIAEKHPDVYRLPENRTRRTPFFKGLKGGYK